MSYQEIEFVINRLGQITSTIKGVRGNSCQHIAKTLQQGLGEVKNVERTTEFYQSPAVVCGLNRLRQK